MSDRAAGAIPSQISPEAEVDTSLHSTQSQGHTSLSIGTSSAVGQTRHTPHPTLLVDIKVPLLGNSPAMKDLHKEARYEWAGDSSTGKGKDRDSRSGRSDGPGGGKDDTSTREGGNREADKEEQGKEEGKAGQKTFKSKARREQEKAERIAQQLKEQAEEADKSKFRIVNAAHDPFLELKEKNERLKVDVGSWVCVVGWLEGDHSGLAAEVGFSLLFCSSSSAPSSPARCSLLSDVSLLYGDDRSIGAKTDPSSTWKSASLPPFLSFWRLYISSPAIHPLSMRCSGDSSFRNLQRHRGEDQILSWRIQCLLCLSRHEPESQMFSA